MKYKIMHLLSTKTLNGAEKVALDICTNIDKEIFELVLVCGGEELKDFFNRGNIDSFKIDISKLNFKEIFHLRKLIKEQNIDLIHAHDVRASIAANLASKSLGIKVISHIHVEYEWQKKNSKEKFIDEIYRNRYSLSLACSQRVKEYYCFHNRECTRDKVISLPNSFNFNEISNIPILEEKEFKNLNNIPKDKYIFGYIGRLIDLKGIDLLIDSFNLFHNKYLDSILIIVGEGVEKGKLIKLVEKYNLSKEVYFSGYTRDIYNWLNIFDSFILPSKREGLPLTILEAMAMKKIVISTDVGGIPELIKNKYNGILLEERSQSVLFKSMEYVYKNKKEVEEIEEHAYEYLKSNYSMDDYINNISNIYKELLSVKNKKINGNKNRKERIY